ncbi:unnamed protein product [marine sediment metagenome]|uniref:Uncharacterized protein n=1 Tax=marine sediment metagenome TaxID=412755 RepID=X0Y8W2_9ZZZZ
MGFLAPRYHLLAGPDEITVTGTSKTLTELGIVFDDSILRLTLLSSNLWLVSWANGEPAVAGINNFPGIVGIELNGAEGAFEALRFITNGTEVKVSVVQEG